MSDQTYANHRRLDPLFHGFTATCYVGFAIMAFVAMGKHVRLPELAPVLLAMGLLVHWFKTRSYALLVQDRVIQLEERLRMAKLLPADLLLRTEALAPKQYVGLRFASDAELADLTRQTLDENLGTEAIKARIKVWRPDTYRV